MYRSSKSVENDGLDMLLTRINEEEKALEKCGVLQDLSRLKARMPEQLDDEDGWSTFVYEVFSGLGWKQLGSHYEHQQGQLGTTCTPQPTSTFQPTAAGGPRRA